MKFQDENTVSIFSRGVIDLYKIYLWKLGVCVKPFKDFLVIGVFLR